MGEQVAPILYPTVPETTTAAHMRRHPGARRFNLSSVGAMTFLVVCTLYFLIPFFWVIVASTKSGVDLLYTFGFWFSPRFHLLDNLQRVFTIDGSIFVQWLFNTFIYAGIGSLVGTFLASMAGYALAKYSFPGRNLIFSLVLGSVLIPSTALALPLFLLMSKFELTNTYWSVLLPGIVSPFGVYFTRIYATASVPDELLEAARLDGASEWRIFTTIATRLMVPSLVTVFLFQFVAIWNNYFLPLIMLSNKQLFPITVGLRNWGAPTLVVPGALVSMLPLLIGCAFLQRYWRSGLGTGSVKG